MNNPYASPERLEHDLRLMLEPDRWPVRNFCLKRWTEKGIEFGILIYGEGIYFFKPDTGTELSGGAEVPEQLIKNGWVAD